MRLIITGGGTGGHLFPAVAVARGIQRRCDGSTILFIGTGRVMDNRVLDGLGFERESLHFSGVKGLGVMGALRSAVQMPLAVYRAGKIISRFRPDLVFGVGGYVTGPVLVAAKLLQVPICIHEQNSVPGLANRLAGKIADRVYISLPCSHAFAEKKTVLTGNPVREEILAAAKKKRAVAGDSFTLLILGGSQGAHRVNELVLEAVAELLVRRQQFKIVHQTGKADHELVRAGYDKLGIQAEVADFFPDMIRLYRKADIVISRAGATTLAELAVMGLPTLLIPFPYAADDHQKKNGVCYVDSGGARMWSESDLSGSKLAQEVSNLIENRGALQRMAAQMRTMGKPDATELIVEECVQLAQTC